MNSIINPPANTETPKWRGIKTCDLPRNELQAITIVNRLGQKSISLPRIDDGKRWAGFPGLAGTGKQIASFVTPCKFYVEPFAGAARVFQELLKRKKHGVINFVLNEKSDFINEWLRREFSGVTITQEDFVTCIKRWDSKHTFFLIDLPWVKSFYQQGFATFDRESVIEYEEQVLSLCTGKPFGDFNKEGFKIKGKFIITTRTERIRMQKAKFRHKTITSIYKVSGKLPKVLLTANFDLRKKK